MTFQKLPRWKDENPVRYEKQQIRMRLTKLRRDPNADREEIKVLQDRYDILDAPMREKRRQKAIDFFEKKEREVKGRLVHDQDKEIAHRPPNEI